jgi:hypothetical protein
VEPEAIPQGNSKILRLSKLKTMRYVNLSKTARILMTHMEMHGAIITRSEREIAAAKTLERHALVTFYQADNLCKMTPAGKEAWRQADQNDGWTLKLPRA